MKVLTDNTTVAKANSNNTHTGTGLFMLLPYYREVVGRSVRVNPEPRRLGQN